MIISEFHDTSHTKEWRGFYYVSSNRLLWLIEINIQKSVSISVAKVLTSKAIVARAGEGVSSRKLKSWNIWQERRSGLERDDGIGAGE
ncbi:MAG TPA: hypothetical protein VFE51_15255 [Verrucomicrobiae bacterium]|nr:hypothetical protein [Verrucomicrobiae bacterium]